VFGRHKGESLPTDWAERALELVTWFDPLVEEEQARIGEFAGRLLTEKRWEAANGFELTEDIRLTIALQASLLILGLSFDHYRRVKTIIVHPTTLVLDGGRLGADGLGVTTEELAVLGLAQHGHGPVVIVWDEAQRNARHPERGFDVVFHEFAHKIDMLDDIADGTPPLDALIARQQWIEVCTEEFEAVRAGHGGLLWAYAGRNPAEFFAVATEVFFNRPHRLLEKKPELYGILRDFYNQDPALQPEPG
jgi:Mlc titration factor MtfA (ptsG expression regulator)